MYIDMETNLKISVLSVCCAGGLFYQKVFINNPERARVAAKAFEEAHADYIKMFGWSIVIKDYSYGCELVNFCRHD